jgi:hypothetical protein
MPPDIIPGFAPGIITRNDDPTGGGRIKASMPGILDETPYWVMPGNWPGGGGVAKGSQYPPPPIGGQVGLIFQYGIYDDPNSEAFYFGGYYGHKEDGVQAGPEIISAAASAADAMKRVVLWEGASLLAYIVEDDTEEKLVLQAKTTGSKIEINAKDGTDGKSETITIEARTGLSLYSRGLLDIASDSVVQIQGRRVDSVTKRGI